MKVLLLSIICLVSCQKTINFTFHKIGKISFKVGFPANHRFIGICHEPKLNKVYFYFGDPVTRKIIKFYSNNGEYEFTVPLTKSIDSLSIISHFQVISPDTIFIFGKNNNQIAIIDRLGNVWKYIDLNIDIPAYNNNNISLVTTYSGECIKKDNVYLHLEYLSKSKNSEILPPKYYFQEALDIPYLLKIDNIYSNSKLKFKFGVPSFYNRFMTKTQAMTELVKYSAINNNIVIMSMFSDSLYFIDTSLLLIKSAVKVKSKFTNIGAEPINLLSNSDYSEYLNNEVKYKGYISQVIYDEPHNLYLISVVCENKKKIPLERDFTYCIYDESGKKIEELFWEKEKYESGLLYYDLGKYYVSTNSPMSSNYNKDDCKFDIYEILY